MRGPPALSANAAQKKLRGRGAPSSVRFAATFSREGEKGIFSYAALSNDKPS